MDSMPISTCTSPISHPDKPTFPFLKECSGDINLAPKFRQLHYPKGSFEESLNLIRETEPYYHTKKTRALHLPEQHYFTHSQYSHLDQYRDKSARDYEHPIKFESRILKDTTTSMHRAPALPSRGSKYCGLPLLSQGQYIPMRLYNKEILNRDNSYGKYEHKDSLFVLTNYPHVSNYTIDPQFVSEQKKKRKTNYVHLKHLHESAGNDGLRYGTVKPMRNYANRDTWLYSQSPNGEICSKNLRLRRKSERTLLA